MFRKDFCDVHLLKKRITEGLSWPNVIINTRTITENRSDIKGTLSVFSSNSGTGYYTAGGHRVKVSEDTFFISNENQEYGIEINTTSPVETFNIHFSTNMLSELQPVLVCSNEALMDNDTNSGETNFYNKLYWKDECFRKTTTLLQELSAAGELNEIVTEEILASLLEHLYASQIETKRNIADIQVVKYGTRTEIIKRLSAATDYIHDTYTRNTTLDELSAIAHLSKFHFLRLFKQMYRCTPYQYIISKRMEKAKHMLLSNELNVQEVAWAVGYEDASSFCRAFRKQYGLYPQAYRLEVKK